MEETKGMSLFGYIIAFVIIVWVISAITGGCGFGGFGFNRNCGAAMGFEDLKAIYEGQKANIVQTAQTQYQIEQQAALTREVITAQSNLLGSKIDFYELQEANRREAEKDRKIMQLENMLYTNSKFDALSSQLAGISCNMLTKPQLTGIAAVCPSAAVINSLGINSLNTCNSSCCGCNTVV